MFIVPSEYLMGEDRFVWPHFPFIFFSPYMWPLDLGKLRNTNSDDYGMHGYFLENVTKQKSVSLKCSCVLWKEKLLHFLSFPFLLKILFFASHALFFFMICTLFAKSMSENLQMTRLHKVHYGTNERAMIQEGIQDFFVQSTVRTFDTRKSRYMLHLQV